MEMDDMLIVVVLPDFVKLLELPIGKHFDAFRVWVWFGEFDCPVEWLTQLLANPKINDPAQ